MLVAIVPSCHSSPPLSSPLSSPPSSPLSSPPGPHHECSPPRRASTEDAPRRRIAQWSCLPGPPPSPLRPRVRAVLHACSSSSRRASSGSHLASCTRVRRSKRPGKTHRDKYNDLNSCKTATAARRDSHLPTFLLRRSPFFQSGLCACKNVRTKTTCSLHLAGPSRFRPGRRRRSTNAAKPPWCWWCSEGLPAPAAGAGAPSPAPSPCPGHRLR